jgi:hypothetical protein
MRCFLHVKGRVFSGTKRLAGIFFILGKWERAEIHNHNIFRDPGA